MSDHHSLKIKKISTLLFSGDYIMNVVVIEFLQRKIKMLDVEMGNDDVCGTYMIDEGCAYV